MNAGQLAALIAAGFWAVLVCAAVYALIRLARLATLAGRAVTEWQGRSGELIVSAQAALDRTSEQLARTDAITANMDQVAVNMAELSGHVSALAGLAGAISGALGGPLMRLAAAAYGVRRAVAIRHPVRLGAVGPAGTAAPASAARPAGTAAPASAARPAAPAGAAAGRRALSADRTRPERVRQ
jgi:hypothetical protein